MKKKPDCILALRDFGVAFGERVILNAVNLEMQAPSVMVLMGPVGSGKSTLLRTIAGVNYAVPTFRLWGDARHAGRPLDAENTSALVAQNAKLMMSSVLENIISDLPQRNLLTISSKREVAQNLLAEAGLESLLSELGRPAVELPLAVQRHLAIARTAASDPRLLCIDEPTANLSWEASLPLLRFIKQQGTKRGVMVVTHNQQDALELAGDTVLFAGGTVQARAPAKQFFAKPQSAVAADFVRTGSCSLPSPGAKPEEVDEAMVPLIPVLPEEAKTYVREALGPRGFLWLKKGMLAGTPKPGIVQEIDYDLEALKRVGISTLVSLTTKPVDKEHLARYGIQGLWMPIKDMHAPTVEEAEKMCRTVAELMAHGQVVAYHCRAGLGRTGTMLASQLIMQGSSALHALEMVRRVESRWVQSADQVLFLERFEKFISGRRKK